MRWVIRAVAGLLLLLAAYLALGLTTIEFRGRDVNCGPTIFAAFPNSPLGQTEYELERGDTCIAAMLKRLGLATLVVSGGVGLFLVSSRRPKVPAPPRPDVGGI